MVDVPAKTAGESSNAVAGYYISTTGAVAPGRVASTSDITACPTRATCRRPARCRNRRRSRRRPATCRRRRAIAKTSGYAPLTGDRLHYSILMPAALITGAHLAISSSMNLAVR